MLGLMQCRRGREWEECGHGRVGWYEQEIGAFSVKKANS
jgi:hypothetical protein